MTDTSFAIADLQSRWHTLDDLDHAEAIKAIHQSGMSLRNLAAHLNCSPSLLTHLLQAAQAPIEDRVLARQGALSTRALWRRARATGIRRTAMHRGAIAFEKEQAVIQGSRSILNWLAEQGVADSDRKQVVEKAHQHLSLAGRTVHLSPVAKPVAKPVAMYAGMPAYKTVLNCRPTQFEPFEISRAADFAWQLAHWALAGIADLQVCQRAFELAGDARIICRAVAP